MRFLPTDEQSDLARTLSALLSAADVPAAVRAWSAGDHGPGRALWSKLAATGLFALAVPEEHGGLGPLPVELAVSFIELGRYGVPGPLVETAAAAALLPAKLLPALADGATSATLTLPGAGPYALDPDAASLIVTVTVTAGDGGAGAGAAYPVPVHGAAHAAGGAAYDVYAAPGHGGLLASADP
ncbi:acyl-CoA dehydrogenase family protein, partial [Streptomyces bambusae]